MNITVDDLASMIDLTLLKPDASAQDIEVLIKRGRKYPFATVCLPPCHAKNAARMLEGSGIRLCTVVGFPLGYQTTEAKLSEARGAIHNGAGEIDMVMNISAFKSGERAKVEDEICRIVSASGGAVVKVIIETCYLSYEEKIDACELVVRGGADFVKTSTGFGPGGATVDDLRLLFKTANGRIRVKASGGIKTLKDALMMIEAGASRVGTSSGLKMVEEAIRLGISPPQKILH